LPASGISPESGWQERERVFVSDVEKKLAGYIGPIAGIIVKRTAAKASDPLDLIAQVASNLHVEEDRKAFLARKSELLRSLTVPVAASTSEAATATVPSQTGAAKANEVLVPLTPERTRRAGDLLARYVGPVAKILAERASSRATNEKALYGMLAEHLQNPAERARFLRDAGYPQSN